VKVHYTELAESDLHGIAAHTEEEFGAEQRDLYLRALEEACEQTLPRFRSIARAVPQRPELLRWRCERHVIYFRLVQDGLEIVRVLHERMLPDLHF
jgi:toxin ParE1/3/4